MRTKKLGTELELFAMGQIGKILGALPPPMRERVANWVASKSWGEDTEASTPVQANSAALS